MGSTRSANRTGSIISDIGAAQYSRSALPFLEARVFFLCPQGCPHMPYCSWNKALPPLAMALRPVCRTDKASTVPFLPRASALESRRWQWKTISSNAKHLLRQKPSRLYRVQEKPSSGTSSVLSRQPSHKPQLRLICC